MSDRFTVARGHAGQAIPEIQLLLKCASAAPGFGPRSGLETLFGQSLDWDALVERAGRHGVLPLVHRALKDCPRVPPRVLEGLDRHFRTNAWNSLRLAWHLADLSDLFRSHGIAAAAFKGPALALAAYGDVTLRQISDLDILVKRSQVAEVVRLLPRHGYSYQQSLPDRSQAAERRVFYNHVFTRERVQVDVHWAFSEDFFPFDIDHARLWSRLSHVRILEKSVETLDVEDTVLVLCVHGARHCWGRLAWIADVAHLVSRHPDMDLLRMLDEARDRGVGRILAVGLTLAGALLEAPISEDFVEQSRSDPIVRELRTEFVERLLCGAPELAAADQWLLYLRLRERLRDRTRCCVRLCELPQSEDRRLLPVAVRWYVRLAIAVTPNTRDYSWVRLPDGLGLLYWLVRPIRLALKVARGGQQG